MPPYIPFDQGFASAANFRVPSPELRTVSRFEGRLKRRAFVLALSQQGSRGMQCFASLADGSGPIMVKRPKHIIKLPDPAESYNPQSLLLPRL